MAENILKTKNNRLSLLNIESCNIQRYSNSNKGVCLRKDIKVKGNA